jgi:2-amino-4-hydroxy-6-hydroxymethyldihydropteridine diphosphokinase
VVALDCGLSPQRLLTILQRIEKDLGRRREGGRSGPRHIDLDILLWQDVVIAEDNLQVPHLKLHTRRFALEPLVELAPDVKHPVLGVSMKELLARLAPQDVHRFSATQWPEANPLVNES